MNPKTYQDNFFEYHLNGAIASAEAVIPVVKEYIIPASIIDIGCGVGAWLSVWKKSGANSVFGVDGEYVDTTKLVIDKSEFKAFDLAKVYTSDKKYDLVTCLEVAEHLPVSVAEKFVESLCALGDVVLFSAAIPSQEGTMHINEQFQDYWAEVFNKKGYVTVDCIRPRIWNNANIQWWYRQNLMFFVKENALSNYPKLKESALGKGQKVLPTVHPEMLKEKTQKIDYYESVLRSSTATLKYFLKYLFKNKKP